MRMIRKLFSSALAFLMMLTLIGTVLLSEICILTEDRDMYNQIACSDEITEKQLSIIHGKIEELASDYSFDPTVVSDLITREGLHQYARQCIDWWMGLLNGSGTGDAPVWPYEDIMSVIREDETFIASVEKYEQKTVARDKIAVPIASTVSNCVLCIRSELIEPLFDKVNGRLDVQYYSDLLHALRWISALITLLLGALIILASPDNRARQRIGYAFGSVIPLLITVLIVIRQIGIQPMIAEASVILAEQTGALMRRFTLQMLIAMIICFGAYFVLTMKGKNNIAEIQKDYCRK